MQVGTREFTGPEALQQYYNGAGGGCRALDRNVCIRPFVTLVMGISLMYPVQGQLHAQDEDDLEAMGWSLVRDREGVAVYNRQFADSKVRVTPSLSHCLFRRSCPVRYWHSITGLISCHMSTSRKSLTGQIRSNGYICASGGLLSRIGRSSPKLRLKKISGAKNAIS